MAFIRTADSLRLPHALARVTIRVCLGACQHRFSAGHGQHFGLRARRQRRGRAGSEGGGGDDRAIRSRPPRNDR